MSEEINLLGVSSTAPAIAEPAVSTPSVLMYEESEDDDEGSLGEGEEELVDDGVSAFIRELQSSIPLLNSDSNGSVSGGLPSKDHLGVDTLKRTGSNSSQRSQTERVMTPEPVAVEIRKEIAPEPLPVIELPADTGVFELQQLETTQFEWTFTESEQSTYERIFGLWERPAEDCVSGMFFCRPSPQAGTELL